MKDKFIFLLVAVLGLAAGVALFSRGFIDPRILGSLETAGKGSVLLVLTPQDITLSAGKGINADVAVETKAEKITVAELQLSFDPKVIHIEDISPGTFFKEPVVLQKEIQNGGGKAVFIIGGKEGSLGTGTIAKVKVVGTGKGSSGLVFTRMTKVAAVDKVDNVLGKARGVLIRVQ